MSRHTYVIEHDIYEITEQNIDEKLKEHYTKVSQGIIMMKIKNAKIITRVKELSYKQAVIHTEVEQELINIYMERTED
mgnify:CR=1 FL=1